MTEPASPDEAGRAAGPAPDRTPPPLRVVEGGLETRLRQLLRLMTRETTPELTELLKRLRYRAPLRSVRND